MSKGILELDIDQKNRQNNAHLSENWVCGVSLKRILGRHLISVVLCNIFLNHLECHRKQDRGDRMQDLGERAEDVVQSVIFVLLMDLSLCEADLTEWSKPVLNWLNHLYQDSSAL